MPRKDKRPDGLLADALLGAAAGAAASIVMDRLDWFMYDHEDPRARERTQRVRPGGMDPGHVVANKVSRAVGHEIRPAHDNMAGRAVHFGLGIVPAVIYGMLRRDYPALTAGCGTAFGVGLSALHDEGLNTVSSLAARPGDYPWQAHARGLVAHIVYGLVLETVLSAVDGYRESTAGRVPRHA